ncbi:MAG: TetR/AcrR family transcriptional regulator [Microbacteriaceae bacterium]|nr:TetR/AcrR family transcriptional regulator [Microbacteriaceae bacterium]
MIIDATMPLLVEHGPNLTSRQIAEAAGVAEGTIFRAFGDKEALIQATIKKFLDPEPLRRELRSIPANLTLDDKMVRIVEIMRKRFSDVFRVMAAIRKPHPRHDYKVIFAEIISEVLAPHVDVLNWPAERSAQVIRLVTFAASLKPFSAGMDFDSREISTILLYGLVGKPAMPAPDSTESQA